MPGAIRISVALLVVFQLGGLPWALSWDHVLAMSHRQQSVHNDRFHKPIVVGQK